MGVGIENKRRWHQRSNPYLAFYIHFIIHSLIENDRNEFEFGGTR